MCRMPTLRGIRWKTTAHSHNAPLSYDPGDSEVLDFIIDTQH